MMNIRLIFIRFEWKVPATDKDMLFAQPPSGIVSSNEVQVSSRSLRLNPSSICRIIFSSLNCGISSRCFDGSIAL